MTSGAVAHSPLRKLLGPFAGRFGLAIVLQGVAGVASLIPWIALQHIVAQWAGTATSDIAVSIWIWVAAVAGVIWLFGQALALHLTHLVDTELCDQLRRQLADHLAHLPLGWFARMGTDGVRRYVGQDVQSLHQLVAHLPADLTRVGVIPVAAFVYLAWVDWRFLCFAILPLVFALGGFYRLRSATYRPAFAARNKALEQLFSDYAQLAQNPVLARQYPGAGIEAIALGSSQRFAQAFSRWVARVGQLGAVIEVVLSAPILLSWVALGAWWLGGNTFPVDRLCVFVILIRAMAEPIQALGHGGDALRGARAAATRLMELLSTPRLVEGQSTQQPADASIHMAGVGFAVDGKFELRNIDLFVPPGSATAIVGPSGSGKSTLLMLAARFMDPDRGVVRLGGIDIKELPTVEVYRQLSVVFQQPGQLERSLAENIALNRPEASLQEIRNAARQANLDARIMALPHQYDSVLGLDVEFSGGELQRLAIARAYLSDAPILLLDEPLSALDPTNSKALQAIFLQDKRTRVMVTHDLECARHADQIIVLVDGSIVQRGAHRELISADGIYAQLWSRQHGESSQVKSVQ